MIYYIELYDQYNQLPNLYYSMLAEDDSMIRSVVKSLIIDNTRNGRYGIQTILPFTVLSNKYRFKATRKLIYYDNTFNVWKLQVFENPNHNIFNSLRYKNINLYFAAHQFDKNHDNYLVNFVSMNMVIPINKINVLPFLHVDEDGQINIDDIINISKNDILTVVVFPKNTRIDNIISIVNKFSYENTRFYICDKSNQMYKIDYNNHTLSFSNIV